MKQILFVALSAVALMFGAAQIAKADGSLNFSPMVARAEMQRGEVENGLQSELEGSATIALSFAPPLVKTTVAEITAINAPRHEATLGDEMDEDISSINLFEGGSESLVAKAVGNAEGTRTLNGGKTRAYYGHIDPGNGRWNQGSFSYQHEARSPTEADEKQLRRLQSQTEILRQKAGTHRLMLSLEAELNGIDLANQAPLAALDQGGYVDRLRQAYDRGFKGSDAVLQARVYSFLNPHTNRWDAPGLGNNESSITHDQERRLDAIAEVLLIHQQKFAQQTQKIALKKSANHPFRSGSQQISKSLVSTTSN